MTRISLQITLLLLILSTSVYAQTEVRRYAVTEETDYGIVYRLPKTELDISITVREESYQKGQFQAYALKFLNLRPSEKNTTKYIIDEVRCDLTSIPDPEKQYLVRFNKNSIAPCLYLREGNIIESVNAKKIDDSHDQKIKKEDHLLDVTLPALPRDYRLATSQYRRAKIVANYIYELRETQNDILLGRAEKMPADGEAMKLILSKLKQEEEKASRLFTGDTIIRYKTYHFRINPSEEDIQEELICRFSETWGLVDNEDLSGEPIQLNIMAIERQRKLNKEEREKIEQNNGLIFNMPGIARIKLSMNEHSLLDTRLPLTQFGSIQALNKEMFNLDDQAITAVFFDTNTGAIEKIVNK